MLKENNDAVAGVVVAILIVGLVIAVISIIQTVYVPKWMEERESEHMEKVADQFSQLKFAFDALSVTEQDIPMTTSITLGSKELGFLMSSKAYGSLAILDLGEEYKITLSDWDGNDNSTPLPILKYSSKNAYYLDQSHIYEAGAVILSQARGDVISIPPSFSVEKTGSVNITFHVVRIDPIGEKIEVGGYGTYPVRTEYINSSTKIIPSLKNLSIETNYPEVWHSYFNITLSNAGLNYGESSDYWMESSDTKVQINFPNVGSVDISFETTFIGVQIGPGWVE